MPQFLDAQSADFEAQFQALLSAKREDSPDVDDAVAAIIADVRGRGDQALIDLTAKFDRLTLTADKLRISAAEVDAACAEALSHNVHSAGVVLNILARHREPPPPLTITTPDALKLACEPIADCNRYDSLRRTQNGTLGRDQRDGEAAALRNEGRL